MTTKSERLERAIRTVRLGHGGNCSSVGSVIDTLFASAVVGGAIFAAAAAALTNEKVSLVRGLQPVLVPAPAKADGTPTTPAPTGDETP